MVKSFQEKHPTMDGFTIPRINRIDYSTN